MTDFPALLSLLSAGDVEHIIVGGLAATVHGSSRLTQDVDVVYKRSHHNIERLVTALATVEPYLRGAPRGLPFEWSVQTVQRGLNFTLTTSLGDVDIFGEIAGGGTYEDLYADSVEIRLFGGTHRCLSLPTLIRTKRAAGRPRDLEVIAELETLNEEEQR